MEQYQKLKVPEGLKLLKHFFLQDEGKPETRMEFYMLSCIADVCAELPIGINVLPNQIVIAQAHVEDNYNSVSWAHRPETVVEWIHRVLILEHEHFEFFTPEELGL